VTRTLVWFRGKDLRVADHAPLRDAVAGGEVIPLFVIDPYFFAPERAARLPHRMQVLVDGLAELAETIERLGSTLVLARGRAVDVVPELAKRWRVDRVVAHRWTEPFGRERDARVAQGLGGIPLQLHEGETLVPPGSVRTQAGGPYAVFTPLERFDPDGAYVRRWLPELGTADYPPPIVDHAAARARFLAAATAHLRRGAAAASSRRAAPATASRRGGRPSSSGRGRSPRRA
jgi:deoxyribodipyrimidine photolyase